MTENQATGQQQPVRLTRDHRFIVIRPDGTTYVPRVPRPDDPFAVFDAAREPEYDF